MDTLSAFSSYAREDEVFALTLANDLTAAGVPVWIDQLGIQLAERWDKVVEKALAECSQVIVILSPYAIKSDIVLDEVHFALERHKQIIPLLYKDCAIPLRINRLQRADFRSSYVEALLKLQTSFRTRR